jgi:putative glutamine amidotransferase
MGDIYISFSYSKLTLSLSNIKSIIQIIDGIIFTGGTDINPLNYEEMPYAGLGLVDPIRDNFEIDLAKSILSDTDIPVLGICRGMQILNVATGGSLYQDLLSQKVTEFNHLLTEVFPRDELSHIVNVTNPSKLYDIFQVDKIAVNSFHHQGIKAVGETFEATMISEDNIIEAIEMKGNRFVVGVQWHPEMLLERYPQYLKLFTSFLEYCHKEGIKV